MNHIIEHHYYCCIRCQCLWPASRTCKCTEPWPWKACVSCEDYRPAEDGKLICTECRKEQEWNDAVMLADTAECRTPWRE